jgi:hypothetical protein
MLAPLSHVHVCTVQGMHVGLEMSLQSITAEGCKDTEQNGGSMVGIEVDVTGRTAARSALRAIREGSTHNFVRAASW